MCWVGGLFGMITGIEWHLKKNQYMKHVAPLSTLTKPLDSHPHRVMAELAMALIAHVARDLHHNPITADDEAGAAAPLPKPMMRENHASLHDTCFVGPVFKGVVGEHPGWEWVNESKGLRPKWGYVAREVGGLGWGGVGLSAACAVTGIEEEVFLHPITLTHPTP